VADNGLSSRNSIFNLEKSDLFVYDSEGVFGGETLSAYIERISRTKNWIAKTTVKSIKEWKECDGSFST
jgi:hypothetical protein